MVIVLPTAIFLTGAAWSLLIGQSLTADRAEPPVEPDAASS